MQLLNLRVNLGPEEVVVLVGAGLGHEVHRVLIMSLWEGSCSR